MKRLISMILLTASVFALFSNANAAIPRSEHPRPDMYRDNWLNLNGQWQFEIDNDNTGMSRGLKTGVNLKDTITVPFCPESKLSGIQNTDFMKYVWYRRHFNVPAAMEGKQVLLHFGAVDYYTWVYVNGDLIGEHRGSNAAFCFDITNSLKEGENEIVVRVFDDTRSGLQPTGKQTHNVSEGCVYTRITGIWQTVWLEAVNKSYIQRFTVTPDLDQKRAIINTSVITRQGNLKLIAEAYFNGKKMAKETIPALWRDNNIVLNLKKLHLWEVGKPNLYDLKLTLKDGKKVVDEVTSYFGMREVKIKGRGVYINGKPVFQRLILDQGYYPDGLWTAPTDDALKGDIELSMKAGFNGARLHQKVFEPRFLYWADKLGYLCWGEYTNWGYNYDPAGYAAYVDEWVELIQRDRNHPAIIGWCPFNETPQRAGELQQTIMNLTRAMDPSRPIYETSGWSHTSENVDLRDTHDYNQDPKTFHEVWMKFFRGNQIQIPKRYGAAAADLGIPFMISEFGGIGWSLNAGWGYGSAPKTLDEFYTRYAGLCKALLDNPDMYGFCYTQLTDIEQEQNGLYYYDRSPKFDMEKIFAGTQQESAFEKGIKQTAMPGETKHNWTVLVGSSVDGESKPFQYTTDKPDDSWTKPSFDDSGWATGKQPFAPGAASNWTASNIWARQQFTCENADFDTAAIVIFYDEDTEVYVNDKLVFEVNGYSNSFKIFEITDSLKKALKTGENTIAIHTHQTNGGQRLDAALLID